MATFKEQIVGCLEQQLSEYELIKSMYPANGEIILYNENILDDIKRFVGDSSEYTPAHLSFIINLHVMNLKLEMCIDLPTLYPEEEPDIYIRSNQLNRQQEKALNDGLYQHLKSSNCGEVCLYTAITWLQENIDNFKTCETSTTIKPEPEIEDTKFVRMWIYSHHIYNKSKRDEIISMARGLGLTGFTLPGKPGIICFEGAHRDVHSCWKGIKSMTWKRIVIRKIEEFDSSKQQQQQKFKTFDELHFSNSSASRNSKHADMSSFSKLMEKNGLTAAFNEVLGLCNE